MKKIYIFFCFTFSILHSAILLAQLPAKDTIVPAKGDIKGQLKEIRKEKIAEHSDSASDEPRKSPLIDSTKISRYGDLLNDDPEYTTLRGPEWGGHLLLNIILHQYNNEQ